MKIAMLAAAAAFLIAAFAYARPSVYDEGDWNGPIDPNATSFTMFEDEYFGPFDLPPPARESAPSHAHAALVAEDHDGISITVTKFKRPDSEGPDGDFASGATRTREVR
jgi:hypothetical protein